MDTQSILIVVGFIVVSSAVMLVYYFLNKKSFDKYAAEKLGSKQALERMQADPDTAKIALWINIDQANGEDFTGDYEYETDIDYAGRKLTVALFKSGSYQLIVSSNSRKKYQNVAIDVNLEPGITYQLGCNSDGVYFVPDPDPARYVLKI